MGKNCFQLGYIFIADKILDFGFQLVRAKSKIVAANNAKLHIHLKGNFLPIQTQILEFRSCIKLGPDLGEDKSELVKKHANLFFTGENKNLFYFKIFSKRICNLIKI